MKKQIIHSILDGHYIEHLPQDNVFPLYIQFTALSKLIEPEGREVVYNEFFSTREAFEENSFHFFCHDDRLGYIYIFISIKG